MRAMTTLVVLLGSASLVSLASDALAQQAPRAFTIEQAVADALANHPRIASSRAEENAAAARVDEARTGNLPDVGVSAQINRSTGNTVPGAFFSAPGFVPVAGAPRGRTFDEGAWQSGVSVWATWDVLSLTRQAAAIDVSLAGRSEAMAATNARRLDIAYRTADAFIALCEAQETVRAAKASVDRADVLVTITKPLVDTSLRPGADLARADAELASARTLFARAEQTRDVRRAQLAESLGNASLVIDAIPGALAAPVDGVAMPPAAPSPSHPEIAVSNAAVARAGEAQKLVDVEYLPRLDIVAAMWMRGSGLYQSPAAGLAPDVPNWAAGAVVTWSFLDIPAIRARARVASATRDAAVARRDETYLAIAGQLSTATAVVQGALRVARQTPAALSAARTAEQQAVARYKSGLSNVVEVADTDRLLAQAELDDAVARLEVRRALLLLARASGDLGPFFAKTRGGP